MASERMKKIEIRDFGGIDRTASSNDTPVQKAVVSRDGRRLPTGKFVRRPEYDFLYDYRNQQFEHTTDDSSRKVRDDGTFDAPGTWGIPNTHEVYRSHGRKNICLGKSGTTEYTFLAYVEIHVSAQVHTLHIERGSRAAGALDVTWSFADANNRCDVVSTPNHAGYASDWIEYSMVMNAAKDKIHLAVTVHETDAPASTIVYHYNSTNDIYQANPASITWSAAATIESDTDITHDVDIEIASTGDALYAVWGKAVAGDDSIMRASGTAAGVWDAPVAYTQVGLDMYGLSIVRAPASTTLYITYTLTEGGLRKLNYIRSTDELSTIGAQSQVATNILTGGTDFYYRGVFAVDQDGSRHWVYLDADGTLTHTYTGSAYGAESYSSAVMTAAVDTTLTNEQTTGWDFVVKNGCVSIFYVDDTLPLRTYKAVRVITSGDPEVGTYNRSDYTETIQHDLVEVRATGIDVRYFGAYRKYERNSNIRLSWVSCATVTTTTNIRFLHSDKGLYEIDDTHSATNSVYVTTRQVVIEAIKESQVSSSGGTLSQILILQCDDNRLYKRVNYMWMLLEGQRLIDNSGWNWVTVYGDHARFLDYAGSVRMLAGDGATNQNAWYGYIDRDFFTNGGDVNTHSTNRYNDHSSGLARPNPPAAAVVTTVDAVTTQADAYDGFTEVVGGVRQTKITTEWAQYQDGTPYQYKAFHVGITYEYDGVTESQMRILTSDVNDLVSVGITTLDIQNNPNMYGNLIRLIFSIRTWDTATSPVSPRLTAVCIYLGEPSGFDQNKDSTKIPPESWFKVKRCQISKAKPTGENAFEDEDAKGTADWTDAGSGVFNLTTYVDYSMWQGRGVNGTIADNLGSVLSEYKSTTSGTEIYTKHTTIPEGYKYGIVLQNEVWAASVRMAGVTRRNRLMRSARKLGSQVTPDGFTDQSGAWTDLPYEILGLSQIDDSNLVVIGKSGIDIFDITGGQLHRRDDITDIGTDATDSVFYVHEGSVGQIIKGVIFKDGIGNIRLFDGYGAAIVSDPIRDDFALTSDSVDANNYGVLTLNTTSLITVYVPLYRTLWLIYSGQAYILDMAGGMNWQNWKLTHTPTAVCPGVDGELFFSDGNTVYVWPQAGSIDNPNPLWRSSDIAAPEDARAIPKNVWIDYICAGTTLQPKVWKDRGAVTNSASTIAANSTQARNRTGYLRSESAARREIAIGVGVTSASALTSVEVDSIVQELLIIPRRP